MSVSSISVKGSLLFVLATSMAFTAAPLQAAKARKDARAAEAAAPGAAPAASDFEAFRIVVDRNIFNPNRTGRSRASEEVQPRFDTFGLVGTMESEQGLVAIFDSTDEALRKAVPEGGTIGGFTVKAIQPASVELVAGDKTQTIRMGQQLRRPEGGEWRLGPRDVARAEVARVEKEKDRAAAPAIPANASDVVRRLMEQRQKQLKQ